MSAAKRILWALEGAVADVLGSRFRLDPKRLTWNSEVDGLTQVLTVELGKRTSAEFTLSWGFAPRGCYAILHGREEPSSLRHDECAIYGRIGGLGEPVSDIWWDASAAIDGTVIPEIRNRLEPLSAYFDNINELTTLSRFLIEIDPRRLTWPRLVRARKTVHSALLGLEGRTEEALAVLGELRQEGTAPTGAYERIQSFLTGVG